MIRTNNTATVIKNRRTAAYADALIGAAQILDAAAKRLRETARVVRQEGLTQYPGMDDPIAHAIDWRCIDMKQTAMQAIRGFGRQVDHLSEIVFDAPMPADEEGGK